MTTDQQNYSAVSLVSFPDHLMSSAMYVGSQFVLGLDWGLGPTLQHSTSFWGEAWKRVKVQLL